MDIQKMLSVARGESKADLLLKNGKVVNTFTGEVEEENVAISGGRIIGAGNYHGEEIIDLEGRYLIPGLIDGHIHLESSHLTPAEYARAVVPRGVLSVVTDFHEIANVCGIAGIEYMLNCARNLPLDIFGMGPSCVPATELETSGARIGPQELRQIIGMKNIIGLGEMMNFPGVIFGDTEVWNKLNLFQGKIIDGHSPSLGGKRLNAYLAGGISSDHECTTFKEAREKLRRGMHIMIREGSSEKNLDALLPLVTDRTFRRCFFVVDDRSCTDLLHHGDVDDVVRRAIDRGLDPVRAIQMATINTAEYFRLTDLGAVAPGYRANLVILSDLITLKADMVLYNGQLVAHDGEITVSIPKIASEEVTGTINIKPFDVQDLRMHAKGKKVHIMEIVPDQILTRKVEEEVNLEDGFVQADIERDILKAVTVERHKGTGNIGLGLVKGFGLKQGALASSIAHDSHNIVAVGTNEEDIFSAIKELEQIQGGLAVAAEGKVLFSLALPIAGLISEEPLETVAHKFEEIHTAAAGLGSLPKAPFAILSFLALPVIPELRLTDLGLVDVLESKLLD